MTRKKNSVYAVLLYLAGFAAVVAGIPVDGLPGGALSVLGMILIWTGWRLVIRQERAAATASRSAQGGSR